MRSKNIGELSYTAGAILGSAVRKAEGDAVFFDVALLEKANGFEAECLSRKSLPTIVEILSPFHVGPSRVVGHLPSCNALILQLSINHKG